MASELIPMPAQYFRAKDRKPASRRQGGKNEGQYGSAWARYVHIARKSAKKEPALTIGKEKQKVLTAELN